MHLGLSMAVAVAATATAVLVLGVCYPYPYREISGGRELFGLIVVMDVMLGPLIEVRKREDQAAVGLGQAVQAAGSSPRSAGRGQDRLTFSKLTVLRGMKRERFLRTHVDVACSRV